MKKIYVLFAILCIARIGYSQIAYQENFSAGTMPTTYTLYCDTQTTYYTNWQNKAWVVMNKLDAADTNNYVAATTSYFAYGVKTADRWMITPTITIPTGTSYILSWRSRNILGMYKDILKVNISTGGVAKTDFSTNLYTGAEDSAAWMVHNISLSSYAGQNIHLAFIDQSTDMFVLMVDDIKVATTGGVNESNSELASISIYPNPVNDVLNITSNSKIKTLKVINAIGQEIFNENINSKNFVVNTSLYIKGIYFVQIETLNGKITKKFVVNK
ncbi:MAG: choice-of-anchor J domain-containing protein [Bacteroidetes bacterium]|nr:choice-of-anchor J domain-containing protein [Bacteroidota bacterium]